ncbi:MAG TPA: YXWGXW repeat-containing protein [Bryobacteraceae bacterium]|nr:YXWGXW repeat-containing protein [Bryobacteraceae bacterium]
MAKARHFLLAAVLLGILTTGACASRGYYYRDRVPPPPPPRLGIVGYAPGPGYVWTDGYYDLRGSRWVWVPGTWMRPPRGHAVWVRPRWEAHGHGYRFHRGHWR